MVVGVELETQAGSGLDQMTTKASTLNFSSSTSGQSGHPDSERPEQVELQGLHLEGAYSDDSSDVTDDDGEDEDWLPDSDDEEQLRDSANEDDDVDENGSSI